MKSPSSSLLCNGGVNVFYGCCAVIQIHPVKDDAQEELGDFGNPDQNSTVE